MILFYLLDLFLCITCVILTIETKDLRKCVEKLEVNKDEIRSN